MVNPFADRLTYGDDRLQGRRDQPKYLNLIKAVAFLRQMQKEVQHTPSATAKPFAYVEVDIEDVRIANKLAHEILGRSLDELSRPGRSLLLLLDEMVEQHRRAAEEAERRATRPSRTAVSVHAAARSASPPAGRTRRVHRYLKELIEHEYVLIDSGRNGTLCALPLAYEGQGKDGERFMLGLIDPDSLTRKAAASDDRCTTFSVPFHLLSTRFPPPFQWPKSTESPANTGLSARKHAVDAGSGKIWGVLNENRSSR